MNRWGEGIALVVCTVYCDIYVGDKDLITDVPQKALHKGKEASKEKTQLIKQIC